MRLGKSLRKLDLQTEARRPSSCGKACGIENHFRDRFLQIPRDQFREFALPSLKAMNSNQLYNSRGINICVLNSESISFLF